jgi:geranylgeranyl reductase family protein
MDSCDVLIVGAGPAGSSCAWGLRQTGLNTVILDKRVFPRDKVCGGWITPAVLEELQIFPEEYGPGRVFQPITGFRTSSMGGPEILTEYGRPISYGIRRIEFDDYLLRRSGARLIQGTPLKTIKPSPRGWIVNDQIEARLVVGAGGHFCPVAHALGAGARKEVAVAAQESEFEMNARQIAGCAIRGEVPELYFCADMKGYGWCFRKGNFLNIGLGRLDQHGLPEHVAKFVAFLKKSRKISFDLPSPLLGHAYLIYRETKRKLVDDGVILIGDAAGLAYSQSGEGIRTAVESGLLAAQTIVVADGVYSAEKLEKYRGMLQSQYGKSGEDWAMNVGRRLSPRLRQSFARFFLASGWFSRHIVLDRWFLHRSEPALTSPMAAPHASVGQDGRAVIPSQV